MSDGIEVIFSEKFSHYFVNFPRQDKEKIIAFMAHVKQFGFVGLQGRNKSSDDVPTDDPNWLTKVRYAQQHSFWHYHIGIPYYSQSASGDLTSEYVLHYRKLADKIIIVGMSPHPPLELPDESDLI